MLFFASCMQSRSTTMKLPSTYWDGYKKYHQIKAKKARSKKKAENAQMYRYETIGGFRSAIGRYFKHCETNNIHPSIGDLQIFLNFTPAGYRNQAARGEEWADTIEMAKAVIKQYGKQKILTEVGRIAFSDIRKLYDENGNLKSVHELDDDTAGAVASIEVVTKYEKDADGNLVPEHTKKIKIWDKGSAHERWMKLYELGNESKVIIANDDDKPFKFEDVSPAKELLASRINSLAAALGKSADSGPPEPGTSAGS